MLKITYNDTATSYSVHDIDSGDCVSSHNELDIPLTSQIPDGTEEIMDEVIGVMSVVDAQESIDQMIIDATND